jgi:tetratricopeptide (TPR) repeat protein
MVESLFGREAEFVAIDSFLNAVPAGPVALVLEGEAGIGKTSLWKRAIDEAIARSVCVLASQPTASEAPLSFAALTELLSGIPSAVLDELPPPQRRALDASVLGVDPQATVSDHRALATGFLSVLIAQARRSRVVVAVDDAQWLDAPSARVLEFALRRLGTAPVGAVISARLPDQVSVPLGLDRSLQDRMTRVRVGPLSVGELRQMIEDRMGPRFPRRIHDRIAETSGGNPFFALEIARALMGAEGGHDSIDDIPIPLSLMELATQRIAALPSETRDVLSAAAATATPTLELLDALARHTPAVDALASAEAAGIIRVDGRLVRFDHPLLAAAVWSSTPAAVQQGLHRRLAELVTDPEEKARHLSAVATDPDEEIAAVIADAARHARNRGAPDSAAELYERSVRFTPETRSEDRWRRAVDAADSHTQWGDYDRARGLLEEVIAAAPAGVLRAEALLQLGNIRYRMDDAFSAIGELQQALNESGDEPTLRSAIERRLAYMVAASGNAPAGLDHAKSAFELLEGSDDNAALSETLAHLTITEFLLGQGFAADRMKRALALEEATPYPLPPESRPSLIYALILLWTDEPDEAVAVIENLRSRLREEGDESGLPYTNWVLGWAELARGNVERAASCVQEAMSAVEATPNASLEGMLLAVAADVYAWQGEVEQARAAAQAGLARTMQMGLASGIAFNTAALGFLELSLGNVDAVHNCLGPLANLMVGVGIGDPGIMRFLPDEIEALVALGELESAAALLEPFEARARDLGRRWATATTARCRGLLADAQGDAEAALAALDDALEAQRDLLNPLDLGRTLVAKGRVHRRRREKRAAQEALREALETFESCGARVWAETARTELARLGGPRPASTELTATEQQVAELAASGLTNRQVAEAAFLAPKTVEGVLARVYGKLGIRSRAELGASMAARRAEPPS